jgi:hypothetical protein
MSGRKNRTAAIPAAAANDAPGEPAAAAVAPAADPAATVAPDAAAPLADPAAPGADDSTAAAAAAAAEMLEIFNAEGKARLAADPYLRQSMDVAKQLFDSGGMDRQQVGQWLHDCHPHDFGCLDDADLAMVAWGIVS